MVKRKVCILGASAVGKGSLLACSAQCIFSEKKLTTLGLNLGTKVVHVDGQKVTLILWDLAGEDDYRRVRTSYLRGAAGYLLVVDRTRPDTLDKALELKGRVDDELGEIPFVLVLNKSDLTEELRITAAQVEELRQDGWDVLETSAKTGQGVEEAFLRLIRRVLIQV